MAGKWSFEGPNPIVGYTVGFEVVGMLPPDLMPQISALGPLLKDDLPRKVEQPAFMFQMGATQPQQQPPRLIGSVIFDDLERDGTVVKQLVVAPNSVTYRTARYQRWVEYWPVAERILSRVAGVFSPAVKIGGFILNAANKFQLSGDQQAIPLNKLIRAGCKFVAPDMTGRTNFSHCFYGFLSKSTDPVGKMINNLNISVAGQQALERWVDFVINVRLVLDSPISGLSSLFEGTSMRQSTAQEVFQKMHKLNNELFAGVVAKELCARIPGIAKP